MAGSAAPASRPSVRRSAAASVPAAAAPTDRAAIPSGRGRDSRQRFERRDEPRFRGARRRHRRDLPGDLAEQLVRCAVGGPGRGRQQLVPLGERHDQPLAQPVEQFARAGRGVPRPQPLGLAPEGVGDGARHARPQRSGVDQFAQQPGGGGGSDARGGVVLVHQRVDALPGDVGGEGRRHVRGGLVDRDLPGADLGQQLGEARQIEVVGQRGAPGLDHQREIGQARDAVEQLPGALAREPERGAAPEPLARQLQRGPGRLAEARSEETGRPQPFAQQRLQLRRVDQREQLAGARAGRRGHGQRVVVDRDVDPGAVAPAPRGLQRDGERPQHAPAPEGVQHQLLGPVAGRPLGDPLDDDPPGVRQRPRGAALRAQQLDQRGGGAGGQAVLVDQPPGQRRVVEVRFRLRQEGGDPRRQERAAVAPVGAPEGGHRGRSRGRRDQHVVVRDLLDPPALHAEREGVAQLALPDELLVQLADLGARPVPAQVEVAAVGDRPAAAVEHPLGAGARADGPFDRVARDERAQLRHRAAVVAPVEHLEHAVELAAGQAVVGLGAAQRGEQRRHVPGLAHRHRDHDLRQHVERAGDRLQRLDLPRPDRTRDDRRLEQVARVERQEAAAADAADLVPGAAQPLDRRGDRGRGGDQQHLVQRADVDPQLERTGGDDRAQLAALEALFHDLADLARERAVVGPGRGLALPFVDQPRQLLDRAPAVAEDQSRTIRGERALDLGHHGGPARGAARRRRRARRARPRKPSSS